MSIKYINLPIYSIAVFGEYIYFAGGGGGSTGIGNQIKIYHRNITPEPANSVGTGHHIVENLTPFEEKQLLVCSANDHVLVYHAQEGGKTLTERYRFKADFSLKDPTINALCFSADGSLVVTGGDDGSTRFYKIGENSSELFHEYNSHNHPIKNVDHNQEDLYLSTDNHVIAICNLPKKQIIRTIHQDQLLPEKSLFQSAYFQAKGKAELLIIHFIFKTATYVTKEEKGKLRTIEVAEDQSCQTAFHPDHKLLGIACGNGTTLMFNSKKMQSLGRNQNHKFVITGCTITRKTNRFLTGTPQCSYHIQNPEPQMNINYAFIITLLVTLAVIYGLGSWQRIIEPPFSPSYDL